MGRARLGCWSLMPGWEERGLCSVYRLRISQGVCVSCRMRAVWSLPL
jgi:hypothetical protein